MAKATTTRTPVKKTRKATSTSTTSDIAKHVLGLEKKLIAFVKKELAQLKAGYKKLSGASKPVKKTVAKKAAKATAAKPGPKKTVGRKKSLTSTVKSKVGAVVKKARSPGRPKKTS